MGQCEGRNLQAIVCVAELDSGPKPLSSPALTVTRSKSLMNYGPWISLISSGYNLILVTYLITALQGQAVANPVF